MAAPTGFSWLAYTLEQDDGGPLHCLEATLSGTDDEPLGVLSRWGTDTAGDSIPDLVVESEVSDPRGDDAQRAVAALRSWLGHARATLGDWSREGFERDLRVQPDTVGRVPDALVVDGVALPGTMARPPARHHRPRGPPRGPRAGGRAPRVGRRAGPARRGHAARARLRHVTMFTNGMISGIGRVP
jgi:hypothetical protein